MHLTDFYVSFPESFVRDTMLDQLSEQNVAEIITAMNEFDGEETVECLWPELLGRLSMSELATGTRFLVS